jgi:type IV pilus assembly protein PilA
LIRFKKGFTLIELLVVVAIIGILAAVGVVSFSGYTESTKRNLTISNHNTALKLFNVSLQSCKCETVFVC